MNKLSKLSIAAALCFAGYANAATVQVVQTVEVDLITGTATTTSTTYEVVNTDGIAETGELSIKGTTGVQINRFYYELSNASIDSNNDNLTFGTGTVHSQGNVTNLVDPDDLSGIVDITTITSEPNVPPALKGAWLREASPDDIRKAITNNRVDRQDFINADARNNVNQSVLSTTERIVGDRVEITRVFGYAYTLNGVTYNDPIGDPFITFRDLTEEEKEKQTNTPIEQAPEPTTPVITTPEPATPVTVKVTKTVSYRDHSEEITFEVTTLDGEIVSSTEAAQTAAFQDRINTKIRKDTQGTVVNVAIANILIEEMKLNEAFGGNATVGVSVGGTANDPAAQVGVSFKPDANGVVLTVGIVDGGSGSVGLSKTLAGNENFSVNAGVTATGSGVEAGLSARLTTKEGYGVGVSTFGPSVVIAGVSLPVQPQLFVANVFVLGLTKLWSTLRGN